MTIKNVMRSEELYERARKVLPGGNTRSSVFRSPHPYYALKGEGYTVTDVDGVERVDFLNNYTSLIHGHRHPKIMEAVAEQMGHLTAIGMPTESEIVLAEILCDRVESFERVRFTNSGTEAVMMAVKAARAHTGRFKIAKCEGAYHGTYDYVEPSQETTPENWGDPTPISVAYAKGTPQSVLDEVVVFPFNKIEETLRILDPPAGELACVLLDPVPHQAGLIPATGEYLRAVRDFCDRNGILLVFDEVVSFRIGYRGAQGALGFAPDLTATAKSIGGGFPVGAVGGRAGVMAVFDPSAGKAAVPHGGTFNGNPITMRAGAAAMELLSPDAMDHINALGERARHQIAEALTVAGVPGQVAGIGSLVRIHFTTQALVDYRSTHRSAREQRRLGALVEDLLDHGVLIAPTGTANISTVMGEAQVDFLCDVVLEALRRIAREGPVDD